MQSLKALYDFADIIITSWMAKYGIILLRISLGVIFFWFGVLKFFPGYSPAQELAIKTINILTFGLIPPDVSIVVLATWECVIGIGMFFGIFMRGTLLLLFVQMMGTFTPIFFFPDEVFTRFPYAWTLEGQYIFKNLILVSGALVIGATVRGGAVVADPKTCVLKNSCKDSPDPD